MKLKQIFIAIFLVVVTIYVHWQTIPLFGTSDMKAFVRASAVTSEYGLINGYANYNLYYPPLSSLIIWATGKLGHIKYNSTWLTNYPTVAHINTQHFPIKISLSFFILLTNIFIFLYLKKNHKLTYLEALNQSLFVGLNVALLEITLVLGYIDIYFLPPLFLSIYFVSKDRDYSAGFWFALTFLIKLIPIILLPVYLLRYFAINLIKKTYKFNLNRLTKFSIGIVVITLPIIYIYNPSQVLNIVVMSAYHGKYLSLNALNVPWILKSFFFSNNLASPMLNLALKLIFFVVSGTTLLRYITEKHTMYTWLQAAIITTYSYFIFSTGAHENHLFTTFILSLALYIYKNDQFSRWLYFTLTGILFLNLFLFYQLGLNVPPTAISYILSNNQSMLDLLKIILAFGTTLHLLYIYSIFIFNKKTHYG